MINNEALGRLFIKLYLCKTNGITEIEITLTVSYTHLITATTIPNIIKKICNADIT